MMDYAEGNVSCKYFKRLGVDAESHPARQQYEACLFPVACQVPVFLEDATGFLCESLKGD